VTRAFVPALIAGDYVILADETTRTVKAQLSSADLTALYGQLKG